MNWVEDNFNFGSIAIHVMKLFLGVNEQIGGIFGKLIKLSNKKIQKPP